MMESPSRILNKCYINLLSREKIDPENQNYMYKHTETLILT